MMMPFFYYTTEKAEKLKYLEKKKVQIAISERSQILNLLPDSVVILNSSNNPEYVNKTFKDYFGIVQSNENAEELDLNELL